MNLNPVMLEEAKNVIYNECGLPESNKEPVHLAVKNLFMLEFAYKDFLSREMTEGYNRASPIFEIIALCGGDSEPFANWFMGYEGNEKMIGMEGSSAESSSVLAWGT